MRKRSRWFATSAPIFAWMIALVAAPWGLAQEEAAGKTQHARLTVYEKPTGEQFFALSLTPPPEAFRAAAQAKGGMDLVVLFDTSASQTGAYRTDSLTALRTLLATLSPQDRVKLMAVDLNAIDLSQGFVPPTGAQMNAALAQLEQRTPLGSTDMPAALRAAEQSFGSVNGRPRAVLYLGDGMSKANFLATAEFGALVEKLVSKQVPVHSYAIGPQRDVHLLAALANHTGGMVFVDMQEPNAGQKAGVALARFASQPVLWPTETSLPASVKEHYPQRLPPLRADRDTILIGVWEGDQPQTIAVQGNVQGKKVQAQWTVAPEKLAEDLAFLPKLMDVVRRDGGLSLPTAGSAGLREVGRVMMAHADNLAKMSARELASGNLLGAQKLAEAARTADPNNPHAASVQNAVRKAADDPELRMIHLQEPPAAPPPAAAPQPAGPPPGFGEGFGPDRGRFLSEALEQQRIQEQILETEVQESLRQARDIMGTAPERVIQDLKYLLESVDAARDVRADVRLQLRNQILAAIREAEVVSVDLTARRAEAEARRAAAVQQQRLTDALLRDQERIQNLMLRFNALMDEGEFRVAEEEIAEQILEIAEINDMPRAQEVGISALRNSQLIGNYATIMSIRAQRQRNMLASLLLVEESHIPFPDEPPIVYPDPAFWESLNERKEKYGSVDLARSGSAEERIFRALDDIATLEFIETPLADVVEFLKDAHNIPIEIDTKALDDVGLSTDVPVTRNLKGITLRSALRLMLRELDLTYMIRDEVLLITTPEEAETQLTTKVYPVADLVMPIITNSINPFQGGGGFGGVGGFNGGGLGGGGGFGGGGFGGGFGGGGFGGGGFFEVKDRLTDDLKLGGAKSPSVPVSTSAAESTPRVERPRVERSRTARSEKIEPLRVTPREGETAAQAWDRLFAEAKQAFDPASVRESVRQLMHKQRFDEVIALIQAALRHGQPQPWMYEAMGLAMQAAGAPKEDLERALMSAVDFGADEESIMYVAAYMAHIGLDERALSLFRGVSAASPHRPEPYVKGLAIAQRLNDHDAIQWACLGILNQAWPKEQRSIEEKAALVAEGLVLDLKQEGKIQEAEEFEAALKQARARDVRISVAWTGDADLDLLVEEPSGAVCSLRHQRTTSGGVLLGDTYAGPRGAGVNGYREVYECPQGFSGVYRLLVRRIWGKPTAGQATVDIYTHYGTPQEKHIQKQIPIGEKDALILFDLADGRRKEPLEDVQVENIARVQWEVNRAILAQQLSQTENSHAAQALAADRLRRVRDGGLPVRNGRNVGFRPVITTLPEGTNFQATAVISADRRYVRITATPLFSLIGDVTTFNFATGDTGGGGGNGNNNGGLGGIGGGLGGLGGGLGF